MGAEGVLCFDKRSNKSQLRGLRRSVVFTINKKKTMVFYGQRASIKIFFSGRRQNWGKYTCIREKEKREREKREREKAREKREREKVTMYCPRQCAFGML